MEEEDIVSLLLSIDELPSINVEDLALSERVAKLADNGISYDRLAKLIKRDKAKRLNSMIWDKMATSTDLILKLIQDDSDLIDVFVSRSIEFLTSPETWSISLPLQKAILRSVVNSERSVDWKSVLSAMLSARSRVIKTAFDLLGPRVIDYSLDWLIDSKRSQQFENEWAITVLNEERIVHTWLKRQNGKLNLNFYRLVFDNLNARGLESMLPDVKLLVAGYEEVFKSASSANERSSLMINLMAIGLNNNLKNSYLLVERVFPVIYQEVISSRIKDELWRNIRRESPWYDAEDFNILDYVPFVPRARKKVFNVEYWDVGRQLIVTVVNNYVRNSWPAQSFINCFSGKKEFKECLQYCYTFEKGMRHLKKMLYEVKQGRVRLNGEQMSQVSKFLK